jgi:ABC-type nitrate/sulfonate/bicarbonate transport system substrate-binding protein
VRIHRWLIRCLSTVLLTALVLSLAAAPVGAAEKLVGLQSAPSVAMALPWFAEEARLYPKYDLDFQLVYIASSGIVTAAMSGGNGSVAMVGWVK